MLKKLPFYFTIIRLGIKSRLIYRMGALLSMIGTTIGFLGQIMIWVALLGNGVRFDTSLPQMITFMIVGRLLTMLVSSSAGNEISHRIRDGSISMDFVRPMNLKSYLFFSDIGNNAFNAIVIFLPIFAVIAMGFGFAPPISPLHFLAFIVTACLGAAMRFYYSYILGLFSFWLLQNPFTSWHFRNVENLFAGQFLPIWMYPVWLASVTRFLPFRYFTYEPLAIYLGKSPIEGVWQVLLIQALWLLVLYAIERLLWHRACRKLIIQGG